MNSSHWLKTRFLHILRRELQYAMRIQLSPLFYMDYEHIICHILKEAGNRGLSVRKIALHVFNASNTLFVETTYEEVYGIVSRYLNHSVRCSNSLVKRASRRGYYCLDDNPENRQLFLDFTDGEDNLLPEKCEETSFEDENNYPSFSFDEEQRLYQRSSFLYFRKICNKSPYHITDGFDRSVCKETCATEDCAECCHSVVLYQSALSLLEQ